MLHVKRLVMRAIQATALWLSLAAVPAHGFQTKFLVDGCRVQADFCKPYIEGIIDGLDMGVLAYRSGQKVYCPPNDLSFERARDIIVGYVVAHPGAEGSPAGLIATVALVEAFKCQR